MYNIHVNYQHKMLLVPYEIGLLSIMPHSKLIIHKERKYLAVPHSLEETKVLRNLDYEVPSPLVHYKWADIPVVFKHQKITTELMVMNYRGYVLNDMGTGKTLSTLLAMHYLMSEGIIRKALIVAPLSTLTTVWEQEIFKWVPTLTSVSLYGSSDKRKKLLSRDFDVYIINHEGVDVIKDELKARDDIDLVVIDELAGYRSFNTEKWKALNYVANSRLFIWGLTGRPTPNAPIDAWSQVRLLTPGRVPKYFKQFKNATMRQVSNFKWIPRPEANTIVHEAMQPAVRFKMDDCIDMPPMVISTREVVLTKAQEHVYTEVFKHLVWQFQNHQVTAANEGVKMSKLLQIAAGFVYTESKGICHLPCKPRIDLLREIIEETEQKVIVFAGFTAAVDMVHGALEKDYAVAKVYGDTPKAERDRIFHAFQNNEELRVIVAHPRCMAHGITLTEANTVIWYGTPVSLEIYDQANARIRRPGQKFPQLIVHVTSTPIERRVYTRLLNRQGMQGALLELFETEE